MGGPPRIELGGLKALFEDSNPRPFGATVARGGAPVELRALGGAAGLKEDILLLGSGPYLLPYFLS